MKATDFWARQHSLQNHRETIPDIEDAYLAGFEKMRELVVGHFESLHEYNPRGGYRLMALLVGSFGKAEVDPETGKQEDRL